MKENLFEYLYVFFNSDEDVMGYIIHIFRPMTIKLIHSSVYKDLSCDFLRNEYIAIADLVLYECILQCRTDQYCTFPAFYRLALKNRLYDRIMYESRRKLVLDVLSLDTYTDNMPYVFEYQSQSCELSVHETVMTKLVCDAYLSKIKDLLTEEEFRIFLLRNDGYSIKEIAEILETTVARVKYLVKKIKKCISLI